MQREPELWRKTQVTDERAKLIFYSAFIDSALDAPRSLLPEVHRLYFEPEYPEFSQRTMSSLSNAFTSAFKKLDPVPQFKATDKLGEFLYTATGIIANGPFHREAWTGLPASCRATRSWRCKTRRLCCSPATRSSAPRRDCPMLSGTFSRWIPRAEERDAQARCRRCILDSP